MGGGGIRKIVLCMVRPCFEPITIILHLWYMYSLELSEVPKKEIITQIIIIIINVL